MAKNLPTLKKEKKYKIHSSFLTIQGEGTHAGRRAVFVRFSGCDVWTGREEDRERQAISESACAAICDTDFRGYDEGNGGGDYSAARLVMRCRELWGFPGNFHVVCTGGEPGLQLDVALCTALKKAGAFIAVETNGRRLLPRGRLIDWVCCSPKPKRGVPFGGIRPQRVDEVKLLYPLYEWFLDQAHGMAPIRWLQPVEHEDDGLTDLSTAACLEYIANNLGWGISVQTHKYIGIE